MRATAARSDASPFRRPAVFTKRGSSRSECFALNESLRERGRDFRLTGLAGNVVTDILNS